MASLFSSLSSMELKKMAYPDQLLSSQRRKAVWPCSFGFVLFFIVLSSFLFGFSSKGPFLQGLHSLGPQGNTSFVSGRYPKVVGNDNSSRGCDSADSFGCNDTSTAFPDGKRVDFVNSGAPLVGDPIYNVKIDSMSLIGDDVRGENATAASDRDRSYNKCDIFNGRWVRDDTKPYYPAGSCPYIDRDFDCHLNGRPDSEYVKWRWQPHACDIPRFNVTDFLERLRGKKLVFVGDSLNRNMWESLVCILRHGVADETRVYEISGKHEFKKKGLYSFRFEDYNCTIDFVSSPFLVKETSYNGTSEKLRLDLMEDTTSVYHDADVIIFNTGHWWTHEKTSRGEEYYQEGDYVHPRLKALEAYKRALTTWGRWVDENIDTTKTQVFFRGYSLTHFRGGPWNAGGQCSNETEPIMNDAYLDKYPAKMRVAEYVLKNVRAPVVYLNISRLTDFRKDGHPSFYRPHHDQEIHAQDCSHWCLPGVPDTWNELLYVSLLKTGRGSWRSRCNAPASISAPLAVNFTSPTPVL